MSVASSDSRHRPTCVMFINLAKNDAGEGQNTNTLACAYMYEKGGLMFKYQMQLRCGTYLAKRMILLAPSRVGRKGILSYECMPPPTEVNLAKCE